MENEDAPVDSPPQKATKRSFDISFKLKVVAFAEANSKALAARMFKVDRKCVQVWVKQKGNFECMDAKRLKRKRLEGAGRKAANPEFEDELYQWICSLREQCLRVTRKMVVNKALHLYQEIE